jgi:hypothetical protein
MKLTRMTVASATAVLLLGVLAGCGGNSADATATDGTTPAAAGASPGGAATSAAMPGASGTIAAISGNTLQVQSDQAGQVAVTWTTKTAITREADATLSDVVVGECVMVGSDPASGSATSGSDTGTVAATSVRITDAVAGACSGGLAFGGPGGRPGGMPGGMPTDRPTNMPPGGAGGFRPGTSGKVTAVSATGFTVDAVQRVPGSASQSTDTTPVAVSVGSQTTYTKTVDATAADLKVGLCAMASGQADNTGAVSATRIGLSNPVDGACDAGFRANFSGAPAAGNQS